MDLIERQKAIDAIKKNTFRLTVAEEQNAEGHVAWSAEAVYSDVMEGALLELPSAQPEQKCKSCRYRNLEWYEEPCDSCTMGGEDCHYKPERKKGKWIDDGDPLTFKCDKCGYLVARYNNTNFCPNCGADMRGEQDETD